MILVNDVIGVSFEFEEHPTWGQVDDFEEALKRLWADNAKLTPAQIAGRNLLAAIEVGLVSNWQSARRPGVPLTKPGELDGEAVLWAGREVSAHMKRIKELSKNS